MNSPKPRHTFRITLLVVLTSLLAGCIAPKSGPNRPAALHTDGVPEIPPEVFESLERYREITSSSFVDWTPDGGGLLISTRHENLRQLHLVESPGATPRLLTRGDEPVSRGRVLPDGRILFSRGKGGDESYQIYTLDSASGKETLITDGSSRNLVSRVSSDGSMLAFTSTRRNGRDADIYLLELEPGSEARRVFEVDRETWRVEDFSPDLSRAVLSRYISRNESLAVILELESGKTSPIPPETPDVASGASAKVSRRDYFFGPRGESLIFLNDARDEFSELVRVHLATGAVEFLTNDIGWDVSGLELSRDRSRAAIVVNRDGYSELMIVDAFADRPVIRPIPLGRVLISGLGFSPDGARLGVTIGTPTETSEAYTIDLSSGQSTVWTKSERAGFSRTDFVDPELIRYPSFDGRSIPAFVFRPAAERRKGKLPVIITIHGGPESQYRPWFSRDRQYYVRELGAAVIAPNVRGSTGYGKSYSLLDNGMKREDSVRDIGALLDWIERHGAESMGLDPDRVVVTGGSYGGYMVLASLVNFGERLRAGVASVGISDFTTFLENTSGYRRHLRRAEYGDERDPEMRAYFEHISPARRIGSLRSALLLVHGKNDPRVPFSETVQVVKRARATGQPVWTLYADNEGHGFSRKENRDYQAAVTVEFLKRVLLE